MKGEGEGEGHSHPARELRRGPDLAEIPNMGSCACLPLQRPTPQPRSTPQPPTLAAAPIYAAAPTYADPRLAELLQTQELMRRNTAELERIRQERQQLAWERAIITQELEQRGVGVGRAEVAEEE